MRRQHRYTVQTSSGDWLVNVKYISWTKQWHLFDFDKDSFIEPRDGDKYGFAGRRRVRVPGETISMVLDAEDQFTDDDYEL